MKYCYNITVTVMKYCYNITYCHEVLLQYYLLS